MSSKQNLILIGGGGHCLACLDVIEMDGRFRIVGIVDEKPHLHPLLSEYPLLGNENDLERLARTCSHFLITIGQIKVWEPRAHFFELVKSLGVQLPTIVSPLAQVSPRAVVQEGTIIMHYAVVNAGARVGRNCIINTKALIEHEVSVGDHCHISTAAVVNGAATVQHRSFIGSNAVVREGIVVGEESIVGAGVTVTLNVASGSLIRSRIS